MDFYAYARALLTELDQQVPAIKRRIVPTDYEKVRERRISKLREETLQAGWNEISISKDKKSYAQLLIALENASQEELKTLLQQVPPPQKSRDIDAQIPMQIRHEIMLDSKEMLTCFHAGAYRSTTILAARMIEVALHRKYYEITGKDILATNPDIGLGKLIAKLGEHSVTFDPGLLDQIHLLNKVRIHAVHKKQEIYSPSRQQAHAMMLLSLDLLQKLFPK